MKPRSWILILVGALLVAALVVDWDPGAPGPVDSSPAIAADAPDLYLEDSTISQYRDDGTLDYQLASTRVRHFENDNVTEMDSPVLDMLAERPWSARADKGVISPANPETQVEEIVELTDNVFLEQTRNERFISLASDTLTVYPGRRYAETDRPVMIDSNSGRTKAVGLTADLDRSVLNLGSTETQRVHTIVLPHQFK